VRNLFFVLDWLRRTPLRSICFARNDKNPFYFRYQYFALAAPNSAPLCIPMGCKERRYTIVATEKLKNMRNLKHIEYEA
jgi:hypothetical protein